MVTKKRITKKKAIPKEISMFDTILNNSKNKARVKKYFSAFNETNKDALKKIGISKIVIYDELGEDFTAWKGNNELVLSILPQCSAFDYVEKQNKTISTTKIPLKEEHIRTCLVNDELLKQGVAHKSILYFKNKNLIVSNINPFVDEATLKHILSCIESINPRVIKEDELLAMEIAKLLTKHIDEKKVSLDNDIELTRKEVITIEKNHRKRLTYLKDTLKERSLLGDKNQQEIDKVTAEIKTISSMPVIKKVFVVDGKIHINFGQISVFGNISDGEIKKGDIPVPNIRKKKVNLGEIEFIIGDGSLRCKNLTYTTENPHPHASESGECCFGESSDALNKLIVDLKLIDLAKMLYAWSVSYNEIGGPYKKLQFFYDREKGVIPK